MISSSLVGALSPVNCKGLHQGWKQMPTHLLLILHKSHETTNVFKIHKTSLNTNKNQNITSSSHLSLNCEGCWGTTDDFARKHTNIKLKLSKNYSTRYHSLNKAYRAIGHAGIVDFPLISHLAPGWLEIAVSDTQVQKHYKMCQLVWCLIGDGAA